MLIALFALLVVLAAPAFSLYSSGTRIPADKRDFLGFYAATLGNMGVQAEDGSWHAVMGGKAVTLASAGGLLGTMDLLSSAAYLLMVLAMTWEVRRRTRKGAALTAKDFAVYVTGARHGVVLHARSQKQPVMCMRVIGRPCQVTPSRPGPHHVAVARRLLLLVWW